MNNLTHKYNNFEERGRYCENEITAKMLDKMEFKRQAKQKFKERFIMGTIEKDKDD